MSSVITFERDTIQNKFDALKKSVSRLSQSKTRDRIKKLDAILHYVNDESNLLRLEKAVYDDFRKSPSEFRITEITPVISNLKFIKRHLRDWMKDSGVETPLVLTGTRSYIRYQAKGVILIIAPWNYPFNLSIIPLLYAIAAGNAIVLKPSEITPHTSRVIAGMVQDLFSQDEITVIEGDAKIAKSLLEQPFNHIFFTGSPFIGKKVMQAAAINLCSVTLELGGKSPAIIDEGVNMKKAAEKLTWGKLINSGQTCTAPDYLFIKKESKGQLISNIEKAIKKQFGYAANQLYKSEDFTRIVNSNHFHRIKILLDDAIHKGAKIEIGGATDKSEKFIAPTLLSNVKDDMKIMQEEIFGPLLPIIYYDNYDDIINEINKRPYPLVIYIQSNKRKVINYIINNTSAGGTVVNDYLIHYGNPDLPFGGINNSGIGKSNGRHGFIEFSNERGIMKQVFGTLKMIYPPYTDAKKRLISWLNKIV